MAAYKNGKRRVVVVHGPCLGCVVFPQLHCAYEPWSNIEVSGVGFLKLVHDFANYITKTQGQHTPRSVVTRDRWVPPSEGWMRVNSDATLLNDNAVEVGAVVRDAQGQVGMAALHR